jgi:hypothetical protein
MRLKKKREMWCTKGDLKELGGDQRILEETKERR